jgi:hypothetical protein
LFENLRVAGLSLEERLKSVLKIVYLKIERKKLFTLPRKVGCGAGGSVLGAGAAFGGSGSVGSGAGTLSF